LAPLCRVYICVLLLKNVFSYPTSMPSWSEQHNQVCLYMCSLTKKCVLLPYLYAVLERKFKKGVLEFAYNILDRENTFSREHILQRTHLYAVLERKFKKGVLEFAYNILDGVEFVSQRAVPEIKLRVVYFTLL